jgi:hypothetical protein
MNARQMGGKRTAIDTALVGTCARGRRVSLVVGGFGGRNGLLDILERQMKLLRVEPLRTPAELRTLQLMKEMPQAVILQQRLVALGNRGVTLGPRRREQRLQRFDIRGQLRCRVAHARN